MGIKDFQWKHFLVACIIVSIGSFFIHLRDNTPPQFDLFFMWLPVAWLLTFTLSFSLSFFLGAGK